MDLKEGKVLPITFSKTVTPPPLQVLLGCHGTRNKQAAAVGHVAASPDTKVTQCPQRSVIGLPQRAGQRKGPPTFCDVNQKPFLHKLLLAVGQLHITLSSASSSLTPTSSLTASVELYCGIEWILKWFFACQ